MVRQRVTVVACAVVLASIPASTIAQEPTRARPALVAEYEGIAHPVAAEFVVDPNKAIVEVENYVYATSQLAQTTLRSVLGQAELDDLLASRDRLNQELQQILDHQTDPWGIKVSAVEVKHVDLPENMQRAMARQAEAEREKRAKIIHAEGELTASEKLSQAATILGTAPGAMTLRYLQTLNEIASEKNSTIIFPLPLELFEMLKRSGT